MCVGLTSKPKPKWNEQWYRADCTVRCRLCSKLMKASVAISNGRILSITITDSSGECPKSGLSRLDLGKINKKLPHIDIKIPNDSKLIN